MKNKKTIALIGIGAFLIVNDLHNHSHFNKLSDKLDKLNTCSNEYYTINEKLDHLTKHTETVDWERTIEIQKEIEGVDLANTVLHEIMHAIVYNSSLNSDGGALVDGKDEEQVVNSMCNQLMMVFRDNTWLLDFIKDRINQSEKSKK